ncbi:hypothetical protein CJF31_00010748 [Rutstroemia sp. NJR-2017a BVV2]|nr:hypothetical protein CJF31_00010748 [Rutstroemia sp. NJR-2017a BVV2]
MTIPRIPLQQTRVGASWASDSPPAWITHMANLLADSKCLEHLTIHLDVLVHTWVGITKSEETMRASLEKTLSPFRVIRGLSKITTTFSRSTRRVLAVDTPPGTEADAEHWARAYLDEFEAGMLRK